MNQPLLKLVLICLFFCTPVHVFAANPTPEDVTATLKRSADWHLANPSGIDIRNWIIAPLYDGLLRTAITTGDPRYMAAVLRFGTQAGWMPANRIYHADDHAVGHAWLDIYMMDRSRTERMEPMRDRFDYIIAHPITEALAYEKKIVTPGVGVSDRWTWCDALYMAPPTLTRLYAVTGDKKYLTFLDQEYRYTYDHLYDPEEGFFYRDARYFNQKTQNGKKIFWSRGNGWVYGGLALLLEHLPADYSTRDFYEKLFKEMTVAILDAQQSDGLWRPSLQDADQIPVGETSGSGFFVFGLAWGVNNGLLDRDKHWPAITRGWAGLKTRVKPDGYVGYVQPIGKDPKNFNADAKQDYGTGAFLLAGSEVLRALGGDSKTKPADLLKAAEAILLKKDQKPRAYARLVPERKDDLAWENDKVAFRVYGPALRQSTEDSGIDAWTKKVSYPILDKWYYQDRTAKISYHKDHGEGMDDYHVGNTRGCGGLGLWIDGKLVTANTYIAGQILWTSDDVAEFKTTYEYPVKIRDRTLYEHRLTRLRLGERLFEVTSFFSTRSRWRSRPMKDFPHEVAIGLVTQTKGAPITFMPDKGIVAIYEPFNDYGLGTGLVIDPWRILRTKTLPAVDEAQKNAHALIFTRPDKEGLVKYRAGFAWGADGEIKTAEQWIDYLEKVAKQ